MPSYSRGEFLASLLGTGGALLAPRAEARAAPPAAAGGPAPDLVVLGGRVLTSDPRLPRAEAFAIKDGRFLAVGSTADVAISRRPAPP